jgi:glutamyl-tRNA synthetase
MIDYYFREPPTFDEKAERKFLLPEAAGHLRSYRAMIEGVEPFTPAVLEEATNAWMAANGLTFKDYAQAVRVALSGRSATPGLFEVMEVLGKERCLARLDAAVARIEARSAAGS